MPFCDSTRLGCEMQGAVHSGFQMYSACFLKVSHHASVLGKFLHKISFNTGVLQMINKKLKQPTSMSHLKLGKSKGL